MPPSSSVSRLIPSAASFMIALPVAVEPVNATLSTPGCWTRYEPVVGPSAGTMLIAPAGKPTSVASSAIRRTLSGVCGSGLSTTEQPAASAGESFQTDMSSG